MARILVRAIGARPDNKLMRVPQCSMQARQGSSPDCLRRGSGRSVCCRSWRSDRNPNGPRPLAGSVAVAWPRDRARPRRTRGPPKYLLSASTESGHTQDGANEVMGHVWTAPGWQGISSRRQAWSEQPCVRPISAVHVTAGHNALRGSGPGQKHAFDNAVAQVGCPDRRIDRLCITCCSPFPTITSRRMPGRDLLHAASATGSL
jgi:hypothetical protein